jgi:predicted esterase
VRLHHDMLLYVLDEVGRQYGIPAERRLLVGFSQPVGMNYRFAATHPGAVRGVIGICGGIPKNWEEGPYGKVSASLLHIARSEDEFYGPAVTEKYAERLRLRANDVEFHLLDSGHQVSIESGTDCGTLDSTYIRTSFPAVSKHQLVQFASGIGIHAYALRYSPNVPSTRSP